MDVLSGRSSRHGDFLGLKRFIDAGGVVPEDWNLMHKMVESVVKQGNVEKLRLFLDAGGVVPAGMKLLHIMIDDQKASSAMISLLLERCGQDPNERDARKRTIFHRVTENSGYPFSEDIVSMTHIWQLAGGDTKLLDRSHHYARCGWAMPKRCIKKDQ